MTSKIPKYIDPKLIGEDAPMTAEIYGQRFVPQPVDTDILLPVATKDIQGAMSPLQRFINTYEPGELVMRQTFRKHLLQILEDWSKKYAMPKMRK